MWSAAHAQSWTMPDHRGLVTSHPASCGPTPSESINLVVLRRCLWVIALYRLVGIARFIRDEPPFFYPFPFPRPLSVSFFLTFRSP
jgi:hypothetical protein